MKIEINKGNYNKTIFKDGKYEVDTNKKYEYYQVELYETYKDVRSRLELEKRIIDDLQEMIDVLKRDMQKEEEKER